MNQERNINVEMCRVVDDLNPFIKVDFVDKDAEEHTGLMMLDSGSNVNLLSRVQIDILATCADMMTQSWR